jgi:hypothetical protein
MPRTKAHEGHHSVPIRLRDQSAIVLQLTGLAEVGYHGAELERFLVADPVALFCHSSDQRRGSLPPVKADIHREGRNVNV